jgi:hypothetical protein
MTMVRHGGGIAIGHLGHMPPAEALVVLMFRTWCEGGASRVARDLAAVMPGAGAEDAARALDDLARALVLMGRRPLMRHGADCACVGGDEAWLARTVTAAGTGAREDALMLLMLMLPPDRALLALQPAEALWLAVAPLTCGCPLQPPGVACPGAVRLH